MCEILDHTKGQKCVKFWSGQRAKMCEILDETKGHVEGKRCEVFSPAFNTVEGV